MAPWASTMSFFLYNGEGGEEEVKSIRSKEWAVEIDGDSIGGGGVR